MLSLGIFQKFSFIIVQSILWHDNGSINPRRQSDKWWGLRFWSWWWLLRQLIHKVNTIMNCKFHFISECIYSKYLIMMGHHTFAFKYWESTTDPIFSLTWQITQRYIDGERENNVSLYRFYNVPPMEYVLNNFLRRSNWKGHKIENESSVLNVGKPGIFLIVRYKCKFQNIQQPWKWDSQCRTDQRQIWK